MRSENNKKVNKPNNKVDRTVKNGARAQKKKKEKRAIKKETVFRLILILILLVAIVGIGMYITRLNTDFIENYNFYQYIGGRKISYEGALKITSKGEITELTTTNMNIQLDSTPLYYVDVNNKALFPSNMELVIPSTNGQVYKINRFSSVYTESGVAYLEYRDKTKELPESFIFDGSNLYLFLDNATLEVDDKEYELTPLSYVVAYNKSSIEIYNKSKDKYEIIKTDGYGIVKTDDYTINVSLDTIKYGDREQLLLKKFDDLQIFNFD